MLIEALANFNCAMPTRTARVNGNQNNVNAILVNAGHTFAIFDQLSVWDFTAGQNFLKSFELNSIAANTMTWSVNYGTVSVVNNQILGIGAVPAATIPIRQLS